MSADLQKKLRAAAEQYAGDACQKRNAVGDAVEALMDHAREQGAPGQSLRPLRDLLAALADANNGTKNPLLEPKRKASGGRQAQSHDRMMLIGQCSAAITLLMRSCGLEKDTAAQEVARWLVAREIRLGSLTTEKATRNKPLAETLKELRDKVMTGERGDHALRQYNFVLDELAPCAAVDPRAAVKMLFNVIAENFRNPRI